MHGLPQFNTVLPKRCVVVTEEGSYLRLIDFCITQLKAQGPSRTCNESKEEEEECSLPRFNTVLPCMGGDFQ